MTKKNLTLEEHKDVGLLLKVANDCLVTAGVKILNSKYDKKLGEGILSLDDKLGKIKSKLDDIVAEEGHSIQNVYYGERPNLDDIRELKRK